MPSEFSWNFLMTFLGRPLSKRPTSPRFHERRSTPLETRMPQHHQQSALRLVSRVAEHRGKKTSARGLWSSSASPSGPGEKGSQKDSSDPLCFIRLRKSEKPKK